MAETTPGSTELTSQYSAQVAGDLERNLKEQERISGEIEALQSRLTALQQDHTVLLNIQQALGMSTGPDAPVPDASAAAPAPRKKTPATPSTSKPSRAKKKTTAPAQPRAGKKPAAQSAPPASTFISVVRDYLAAQKEPRSAAEIAAALQQQLPGREIQTKVVRLTLESLVSKSQAQRTRQGRSVFYTPPEAPEPAAQDKPTEQQPA